MPACRPPPLPTPAPVAKRASYAGRRCSLSIEQHHREHPPLLCHGATRFEACDDFDHKRTFLRDYVERIIFDRGRITILGTLPLDGATPRTLPFRIEGEIAKGSKRRWAQGTNDLARGCQVPL